MRVQLLLTLCLFLGACSNRVFSERPWFASTTEAAPRLKPGLWVATELGLSGGKTCRFDEDRPFEEWPDCVSGFVVREDEILRLGWWETTALGRTERGYFWDGERHTLVSGDPVIDQVENCPGLLKAYEKGAEKPRGPHAYCYDAMRPTRFDVEGQVTAAIRWPVLCGPWPSRAEARKSGRDVTVDPFAGLQVVGENCTADSEASLRRAAKISESLAGPIGPSTFSVHWVRAGYR